MATKIIGLDLGTHTVKVCELVTTFRNFELVGFGSEPVDTAPDQAPSVEAIAEAAQRLLSRRGLLGETLMCALPPDLVSSTTLEFPFDQRKKIEAVLPFELDEIVPFDVEDLAYDYQVIERIQAVSEDGIPAKKTRGGGPCRVLVAYTPIERYRKFLDALQAVGIDPKVVSIGALSYFNLYDHFVADPTGPVAALDIGHRHSELAIFDEGEPRAVRSIGGGGRDVTCALGKMFQVDVAQAERGKLTEGRILPPNDDTLITTAPLEGPSRPELISRICKEALTGMLLEVRRALIAYEVAHQRPLTRLFLTGGGSQLRGLSDWLQRELGIEVQLLDPLSAAYNRLPGGGDPQTRALIGKPLALSLRAFHSSHQSFINFRKGEFAFTGELGFMRGRILSVALAMVVLVVLASMVAVSKKRVLEAEFHTLNNQVRAVSVEILDYESDDVDLIFSAMMNTSMNDAALLPQVSAFEILADLSEHIDFELSVDLDRFEYDVGRRHLRLKGKTATGGDVERLVDAVKATRCFGDKVKKDRVEKSVDDRTKFEISATSTCG